MNVYSMCLPHNRTNEELMGRCLSVVNQSIPVENITFSSLHPCPFLSSTVVLVLSIVILTIIVFFGVVIYYNCKKNMTGSIPFVPMECCPNCLFPREMKESNSLNDRMNDGDNDDLKELQTVAKGPEQMDEAEEKNRAKKYLD